MKRSSKIVLLILVALAGLSISTAFYRFMVLNDYMVIYDIPCDPATHSCFVDCADDDCTETYSFARIEKDTLSLISACGNDVSNCDQATVCLETDQYCSISYCNPTDPWSSCAE